MFYKVVYGDLCRVLDNSKFGVFYSNFLPLTPTFCKVTIKSIVKLPTFSGRQHFYSYFQNPSENSAMVLLQYICQLTFSARSGWPGLCIQCTSYRHKILQTIINTLSSLRPLYSGLFIPYYVGHFVGPGTRREGSLVRGWRAKMNQPKLLICFSSFPSTILLILLSCSLFHDATPHYTSQVWRQRIRIISRNKGSSRI